jgi:hypothetical protein
VISKEYLTIMETMDKELVKQIRKAKKEKQDK